MRTSLSLCVEFFNGETKKLFLSSYDLQNLESLLRLMQNVVERHSETEVLENCAKTLEIFCTEEHAIYSRCDVIRSTLIDRLVNKLREVLDDYSNIIAGVRFSKEHFQSHVQL